MNKSFYKQLIEESPIGYAYHRILCDKNGVPCDYKFIDVNTAFEAIMGIKRCDIIGKKISVILPDIKKSGFNWINFYGDIAINGGKKELEQFSESLKCWFKISVYSPEKYYFTAHFTNIDEEKKQLTELKNIASERNAQNEYAKMLLNTVPSAVFSVNNNCEIMSWNKRAESIIGYTSEEIWGNIAVFLHWTHAVKNAD